MEARDLFIRLNDLETVATALHQIGVVYKRMRSFEQAECAYRESLAIKVKRGDKAGKADSLNELGNLYDIWGKSEQAVIFYRQAADIYALLGNNLQEGRARSNLAMSLIRLERYEEARAECLLAIERKKAFGHSAEPWTTWCILHDLEQASGNLTDAKAAKHRAIQSYLAYRREGGENVSGSQVPKFCEMVLHAGGENTSLETGNMLLALKDVPDLPDYLKPVIPKLLAILQGERNTALADDPALDYNSAAELLLLLDAF
ncbi:MAG: tetratricopeptide repeat protein [Methylosarcina sp.]